MKIDPHVHFRDEEQNYKETITHGLLLAREQGADIVFDMPNTAKPIISGADVERRLALVPPTEKERYFLFVGATADEKQLKEAAALVKNTKEVIGIKLFAGKSVGDLAVTDENSQKKIYEILSQVHYDGVLAVHCEKEKFIKNIFNPKEPFSHCLSRPKIAEIESVKDQIRFASETGFSGTLHVCHISCRESLELVEQARPKIKITCGVTPHHLMWSENKFKEPAGLLYKTNPPLRSEEDVQALRQYLKQGKIDWIETDHAPHAIGEKLFGDYPSGFPSLYLYRHCVEEFLPALGLNRQEIENLTFGNINKVFKIF